MELWTLQRSATLGVVINEGGSQEARVAVGSVSGGKRKFSLQGDLGKPKPKPIRKRKASGKGHARRTIQTRSNFRVWRDYFAAEMLNREEGTAEQLRALRSQITGKVFALRTLKEREWRRIVRNDLAACVCCAGTGYVSHPLGRFFPAKHGKIVACNQCEGSGDRKRADPELRTVENGGVLKIKDVLILKPVSKPPAGELSPLTHGDLDEWNAHFGNARPVRAGIGSITGFEFDGHSLQGSSLDY
jgi:hypothetical protein